MLHILGNMKWSLTFLLILWGLAISFRLENGRGTEQETKVKLAFCRTVRPTIAGPEEKTKVVCREARFSFAKTSRI